MVPNELYIQKDIISSEIFREYLTLSIELFCNHYVRNLCVAFQKEIYVYKLHVELRK